MLTRLLDVSGTHPGWVALAAFLLGTIARDTLGEPDVAGRAQQRALDLAEPDQLLSRFLRHPPPGLLDHRVWRHIADAALTSDSAGLPARVPGPAPSPDQAAGHREALTHGETRVLNYLPTNLSALEIAGELYLSVHTVRTYQRRLYQKLGARSRTQAVEQARVRGLLAPSARRRA
jgi:LuxR family maltose regulon positive regulatory protein